MDDRAKLGKNPSDGFIFTGNISSISDVTLLSAGERQWSVKVSLKKCDLASDKKSITCDLKLTTGSDLDWSTKVSAKAKFTISQ